MMVRRFLITVSLVIAVRSARADEVAIVWDEPAAVDNALTRARQARELSRDVMWVSEEYPKEIDGKIVLGFCAAADAKTVVDTYRAFRPGVTSAPNTRKPSPTSLIPIKHECPDARGVTIAKTATITAGKLTLTVVALVIASPKSTGLVQGARVTYHAFLREGTTQLEHWAGGNNDYLGKEQPRVAAQGNSIEVVQPCHLMFEARLESGRKQVRLSIAGRKIRATASLIERTCDPVPDS